MKKFTKEYYKKHGESNRFKVRTGYPYAIFTPRSKAEEFVEQLMEHYGFKADIILHTKGSATSTTNMISYWDIVPQYGKAFAIQHLSRLFCKGITWGDFYRQPVTIRMRELQELSLIHI